MGHKKITADEFTCERCGHVRIVAASDVLPGRCAKCKSPYWNQPRKLKSGPKKGKGITIRPKAPAPKTRVPKKTKPAAPAPAEPTAVRPDELFRADGYVSRHCKAGAHAGCKAPVCGCSCHK